MNIVEKVNELNKQIESLKAEFKQHISNKAIPLDERWELFLNAPRNLREHSIWIERFEGLPEDFIGYESFVHAYRHQTVTVKFIMEMIEEIQECPEDYGAEELVLNVVAFKEDVLSRNLYSFEYDW